MGNDDKINSMVPAAANVHKEVALLLENELNRIAMDNKRESFSIEDEFSKTKKNSFSFMWQNMWLRLLICFGVVFAITVFLVLFVANSNREIKVEVSEFKSLNLTSLLNKVNDIDQKIHEIENAKKAMEQLGKLKGCEMHTSVILSESDERVLKKLQINLTSEPKREGSRLYTK